MHKDLPAPNASLVVEERGVGRRGTTRWVQSKNKMLEKQLTDWETLYHVNKGTMTYSGRFITVIKKAREQTGLGVVVLIDEYDKPLLRSFHDEELQQQFRSLLMAFYTVLKTADPWLKFVFITGVTKFAQVGVLSELNQLNDISLDLDYAALCGLTQNEIQHTFAPELDRMATANQLTHEQLMEEMTRRYDGYRPGRCPQPRDHDLPERLPDH